MEACRLLGIFVERAGVQVCHSEERSDVGISCNQLRFRRWPSCDPSGYCEIATSAYGLLAMTNLGAVAILTVARSSLQHCAGPGCPLPYIGRCSSAVPSRDCTPRALPRASRSGRHVGLRPPRNDKSGAGTVLTIACANRRFTAGRGMPLPYNAPSTAGSYIEPYTQRSISFPLF